MEQMLEALPRTYQCQLYFGPDACEEIFEQQLFGHSWLLRGLVQHYNNSATPSRAGHWNP